MTAVAQTSIEPDESTEIVLPVRPVTGEITVTVALGRGAPVEKVIDLLPLERSLLAVVAEDRAYVNRWLVGAENHVPMPVAANALPQTAAGYEPVSMLVVTGDALRQINSGQQEALRDYLRLCGRVVLAVPAPEAEEALRAQAGHDTQSFVFTRRAPAASFRFNGIPAPGRDLHLEPAWIGEALRILPQPEDDSGAGLKC